MEAVKKKIKMEHMIVVDCVGEGRKRSGGLALLWQHDLQTQVVSFSPNHIDVFVDDGLAGEWRFTGIYGFPEDENKEKTGALLKALARATEVPWLCGGDFNLMVMASEEKAGGDFNVHEAEILRSAMEECRFIDMGFVGYGFTWSNNRGGAANIQERLDRFFMNKLWQTKFPGSFVSHLTERKSDHLPLVVSVRGVQGRGGADKKQKDSGLSPCG